MFGSTPGMTIEDLQVKRSLIFDGMIAAAEHSATNYEREFGPRYAAIAASLAKTLKLLDKEIKRMKRLHQEAGVEARVTAPGPNPPVVDDYDNG